jgi:ribose transport system substrate-binding protein
MKARGRLAGAVALLVALGVAACGSSSDDTSAGSAPATAAATTTSTSAKTHTADDVKGGVEVKPVAGWKPLHVAFFGYCSCNSYTATEAQGMKKALDQLNNGSSLKIFSANYSATTQANQIADAVTSQKYNAFIILPIDGAQVVPSVKQAVAAGIKVGAMSFPIGPSQTITDRPQVPGVVISLLNNPVADGAITGERTKQLCEGKSPCNIVVMTGPRGVSSEVLRVNAVKKAIGPNAKIVLTCDGAYTAAGGFKCMQNALQVTKDIDVVMSPSSDSMLVGAQKALGAVGIKIGEQNPDGKFKFVGLGASETAVNQIKAGLWDSSRVWLGDPTVSTVMISALDANVNGHGSEWPQAYDSDAISPIGKLADKKALDTDPSFKGEWCC